MVRTGMVLDQHVDLGNSPRILKVFPKALRRVFQNHRMFRDMQKGSSHISIRKDLTGDNNDIVTTW